MIEKLRPAKVSSALRRRWFERSLGNLPLAPGPPILSLGSAYGGWNIPDGMVGQDWICYCIGAGPDIGFDLELIRRWGVVVRCVDPVQEYQRKALEDAAGESRFSFRLAAVTASDGPIRMQRHHESDSRSVSSVGLYDSDNWVEVEGLTIPSLMREFGDQRIDLLKLDVEGAEYELLPTIDLVALGVRVFSTQLHHNGGVRAARALIDGLRAQGFRLVAERPVVKLTFIRD